MLKLNCNTIDYRKRTSATKKVYFSLLLLLAGTLVWADTEIVTSTSRVTLPPAGNQAFFALNSKAFYFAGPSSVTSQTTTLKVESRIPAEGFTGSTGVMKLMINGAVIQAYVGIKDGDSGSLCRLTNKPVIAPVTSSATAPWFYEVEGSAITNYWRVIYADNTYPSFPSFYNSSPYTTCNPYRFELDITDLLKPSVQNEVRITNLGTNDLEIITLSVNTTSGASPLITTGTATISQVQYSTGGLDFYATVTPAGGALLKMYTGVFPITSGNHYWWRINGGTATDVVAASGGILKITLPQGTSMHIEIGPQ